MLTVLDPEVVTEVAVPRLNPVDALEMAATLLETDGWIQGQMCNANGHCLLGALMQVTGTSLTDNWSLAPMGPAVRAVSACLEHPPGFWNDYHWRTKEEVVAKLHEAADWIRSNGNTRTTTNS